MTKFLVQDFSGTLNATSPPAATPATVTQQSPYTNPVFQIIYANYGTGTSGDLDITYSQDTVLTNDIYADNLTIDSGVTIVSNGFNIYLTGTFTNNGTIITGTIPNTGGTVAGIGKTYNQSYGGAGGGGQGTTAPAAAAGGSTTVAGGVPGSVGGTGGTGVFPTISNTVILSMFASGMSSFLIGAGGGGAEQSGTPGANATYGIYIQCNDFTNNGTINAGGAITPWISGIPSGGGGGGGAVLAAYGNSYTAGTITTTGGINGSNSGTGGTGASTSFNYTTPPISLQGGVQNFINSQIYISKIIIVASNNSPKSANITVTQLQLGNSAIASATSPMAISVPANSTAQIPITFQTPDYFFINASTSVTFNYISSNTSSAVYMIICGYN